MRLYPPVIAGLYLLITWFLEYLFPFLNIHLIFAPYHLIGLLFLAIGLWLILWSSQLLLKKKTTHNPYGTPIKLITTGPFKITRNPMYLGMSLIIFGITILSQNLFFFLPTIAFPLTINKFFILREEKKLISIFKQQYLTYQQHTQRWL